MSKIRYTLLIGALFLALLLSAVNTAPVFADESTPPSETSEETTTQETESAETQEEVEETESTSTEEEATESSESDGEEETPQTSGEPESTTEEESNPVTEILEQLPEGTEIVVLDENGEPISLATQQAEESVPFADPRWCPAGVVPNNVTCSPSYENFLDLINWLTLNNPAKAGVIWVDASYDSEDDDPTATDIILNGSALTNMANYAITIQGGWLPAAGFTGKAVSATDLSEFHVPFKIIGWNAPITINNISINNVASGDYALEVNTTKGAITLNNVEVVNNTVTQAGASLTNSTASVPAGVTVNNSNFDSNTANGLEILSKGAVNLKNLTANANGDIGASINNTAAVTAQPVNLTGTNSFNYNGLDGLVVFSKGVITLNYITANYNSAGSGVMLDNCLQTLPGVGTCLNTLASGITIKGINDFSYNGWDGLRAFSNGVITVTSIVANNNGTDLTRDGDTNTDYDAFGKGVYLDNSGATLKRAINVVGINIFNNNISNGLFAVSDGLMTISNITANKNGCDEIKEGNNQYCAGVYLESFGGVNQTGYANFVDNLQDGLRITTYNTTVTLTSVYAADNGKDGIHIDGGISSLPATIIIKGTNNTSNHNGQFGIWINTNGSVSLANLTANYNTNSGLYVDNTLSTVSRPVTITGVNTFQGNNDTGLTINSRGAITTYSINSVENAGQAAILDNCDVDGLDNCQTYTAAAVSMYGVNYLNNNVNGLAINSRGAIVISNLTSIYNGGEGAVLRNDYLNAVGGVAMTGANNISNNGTYGMEISTRGAVAIANITANYNHINGVEVYNNLNPVKPANVTFTGTNRFNDNGGTGLVIRSHGAVTLYNVTANNNGNPDVAKGVFIDNATNTTSARNVFVYGYNYFNDNTDTGLHILSNGAITVQRVTANNNNGQGAYLNNVIGSGTQAVTIAIYGIFLNNSDIGLQISSSGSVIATSLTANNNVVHGVAIDTQYGATATSAVNVNISGYNNFNNNGAHGLQIKNDGAITLTNIFASSNSENGVLLDNLTYAGGSLNKTIIINGVNNFSNNGENGLEFYSNGAVTLNRLTAFGNDTVPGGFNGSGIVGVFSGSTSLKTLTFNCGSLMGNETFGMDITGASTITLRSVYLGQSNEFNGVTPVITRVCPLP